MEGDVPGNDQAMSVATPSGAAPSASAATPPNAPTVRATGAATSAFDPAATPGGTGRSTPAYLRRQSIVIVVTALVAGLLSAWVVDGRRAAVERIADNAEPLVVAVRSIQTDLAAADAAAANAFLAGGIENATQRLAYEQALDRASNALDRAVRRVGDDEASHAELTEIIRDVQRYSGLVETARANNRQGFPVGAAYLTAASRVLSDDIYPLTDGLANRAEDRYRDEYNDQLSSSLLLVGLALASVAVLIALLARVQRFLSAHFRRSVNVALAASTVTAVGLFTWLAYGFNQQASQLRTARLDGYHGVRLMVDARAAAFGAKGDESRFLIARGNGDPDEARFQTRVQLLESAEAPRGLLAQAADSADDPAEANVVEEATRAWRLYRETHDSEVVGQAERDLAVATALTTSNDRFDRFDLASTEAVEAGQAQFDGAMDRASRALRFLTPASVVLAVVIALLAGFGLQLRINEYR